MIFGDFKLPALITSAMGHIPYIHIYIYIYIYPIYPQYKKRIKTRCLAAPVFEPFAIPRILNNNLPDGPEADSEPRAQIWLWLNELWFMVDILRYNMI